MEWNVNLQFYLNGSWIEPLSTFTNFHFELRNRNNNLF